MAKKPIKFFKARISKRINNLSRAINKIDPEFKNRVFSVQHVISDIRPGINDVRYIKNGEEVSVRYDQIENLPNRDQASLLNKLSLDRAALRQERGLQQIKEKGKISRQFRASLVVDNPKLLKDIEKLLDDELSGNTPEMIQEAFKGLDISTGENFLDETDSFFQGRDGTPELFDFFRPGEAGGFKELNAFTWNAYKILKGI